MKTLYKIMEESMDFPHIYYRGLKRERVIPEAGCTNVAIVRNPREWEVFEGLIEAKEALQNYKTSVWDFGDYYNVTEYYVEKYEVDEDGEEVQSLGIWGYTPMIYEVVEKNNNTSEEKIVAEFNNYSDADLECWRRAEDFKDKCCGVEDDDNCEWVSMTWEIYVGNLRFPYSESAQGIAPVSKEK